MTPFASVSRTDDPLQSRVERSETALVSCVPPNTLRPPAVILIPPANDEEAAEVERMFPPVKVRPLVERRLEALSPWKVEEAEVEVALIVERVSPE